MTKATGQRISAVQASHQQPLVIFLSYFSTNPTHLFGESVDHSWPSSVFFSFFWWWLMMLSFLQCFVCSFGIIWSNSFIFSHFPPSHVWVLGSGQGSLWVVFKMRTRKFTGFLFRTIVVFMKGFRDRTWKGGWLWLAVVLGDVCFRPSNLPYATSDGGLDT